jgi:hypothetical protein
MRKRKKLQAVLYFSQYQIIMLWIVAQGANRKSYDMRLGLASRVGR